MTNEKIFHFFNSLFPFNQEGLKEFAASFETKTYPKNTLIIQQESIVKKLMFLSTGSLREFFAKDDKEMNTDFFVKPQFINDFYSLMHATPTKKNIQTLTEVTILELSIDVFHDFLERYQCGKNFVDEIFKDIIAKKEEEEFKHFSLTPDELYLDLLSNKPEWLQEIPLYHIATYLRMTPETLSRIRKRN
ncbi:cyclic nucleotide-binding domain-containing protein [Flammeovirga yaeyamensis]|uniref:Cyclic nucleotide-binding domain-containing protein n=1 Tax=Flammeovirga yaeyamensis TaxID=367791 RepID=A0AAX1NBI6_9BACT|nr:Crp/Fnr family transcriptional regulator [Flammeovirga yaeyamensis]MBB3697257.1 CRP-like cAMP-binding protein [Flammeovirga yaeyamensis]NMF33915.1 Crp/Fnr family transcriptional regulator [Flammeovirga yaeyamensis]QWG04825.1 cyclic nucleotide-binding domain-containing protein [Flammeovirga yaeyamensis]